MAPFLRAGLHGLRSALCSHRERCLLKAPESKYIMWRWYGETAVLEDATQPVTDTAGESASASKGPDVPKTVDDANHLGAAKETLTTSDKPEDATEEPSTDKLTNLILGKMRSKFSSDAPKDNTMSSQTASTSPKAVKLSEVNLSEESKQPARGDKWDQVMKSMHNLAAKRTDGMAKAGVKPTQPRNQDDFADLDLPLGHLSKALSNSSNLPSTEDAFKSFISNSKQREVGFQASNVRPKAREAKAVSFSFLKALDNDTTTPRAQSSGGQSFSDRNVGMPSSSKPKDNGMQGLSQPTRKEGFFRDNGMQGLSQPTKKESKSFDSLMGDVPLRFDELRRDMKTATPFEPKRVSMDKTSEGLNSNTTSTYPGYTVCIHNLSSHSNLDLIKGALSVHGEVISSFKQPNSDGSCSAFIEFKMAEAMDDALASRWLQIDSKAFGIVRADLPITTVVRLSRVSSNTTDSQLQATCEKFGGLDNIRKRGNGIYDVFYKVGELSNMAAVLDSLNEVTLNQRRWVALPAPLLHPGVKREVLKSSEGKAWHANQLSQILSRIEVGLDTVSLCFEDLKALIAMEDEVTK